METDPAAMMTRERITDEHRLIEQSTAEFMTGEVLPVLDRLEQKDWALNRVLLQKCGALGLLGTNVSDTYGGVDLDKVATLIVSEQVAVNASFAATFGAQANLTILPIYLFGTDAQKSRYLPALVAGDLAGAYCLSESGSGSDALGAAARAMRQADGSFVLSGEKMWITNGGFADVFIVFAKVDGEHFTAFIVERGWPGVSSGKEEHKMGLHGSSTTPVILQDVAVPADAVLGEIGKGHKVAFNVLNFGRFKLGAMTSGGAKGAIADSAKYAATRKQFGVPIATFGAIRHKLGEMTAREYALESLLYRTAGLIDEAVHAVGRHARGDAAGPRGVRHRGLDCQGLRQRSGGLHHRRERADPRRQRLRHRLPGGAALPRRAREPHLRGHQRDQSAAHPGHAHQEGAEGRPAAHRRGPRAAGRDHGPLGAARRGRPGARRRNRRPWRHSRRWCCSWRARPCSGTATRCSTSRRCCRRSPTS